MKVVTLNRGESIYIGGIRVMVEDKYIPDHIVGDHRDHLSARQVRIGIDAPKEMAISRFGSMRDEESRARHEMRLKVEEALGKAMGVEDGAERK